LRALDRRSAELNEIRWWSRWARLRWHGEGYLLSSDALREPFFNRAGALTCGALEGTTPWAERELRGAGLDSTLLVFDRCASVKGLVASGYEQTDTMTVLRSNAPRKGGRPGVEVRASTDPDGWTAAYLRSFYGDETLTDVVRPIVAALKDSRAVTLLEAGAAGETAGVLAMFRTPGLVGVYCVGTVPELRGRGVATALLARAWKNAQAEGRILILQTLTSDGALQFYLGRGFEEVYSKRVLKKKLK
jgi:GNAT superfamily N-acetyltransferase